MSSVRSAVVGVCVGAAVAAGTYLALAPSDSVPAPTPSRSVTVPRSTTTSPSTCAPPAKLVDGACVTVVPGPTVTVSPG